MDNDLTPRDVKVINPDLSDQGARDLCEFAYHYQRATRLKKFMVNSLICWYLFTHALANPSRANAAQLARSFQVMLWPELAPVLVGLLASTAITWGLAGRSLLLLVAGLALSLAAILQARRV